MSSSSYRPIANATPLGLLAFGTTTAILSAGLATIAEKDQNAALTVGFAFGFGGVVQFLAGIIEFIRTSLNALTIGFSPRAMRAKICKKVQGKGEGRSNKKDEGGSTKKGRKIFFG